MFKIITETSDFIIVDKISNSSFHDEGDLGSGFFSMVKKQMNVEQLFPVHRLDKMTSGLILFAKNITCAQLFGDLFKDHKIEKFYIAISDKKPTKKQGLIKGDMNKSRRGTWKLLRTLENPAITQFYSYSISQGKRLFLLKPHSGKTHQIRVALNSISSPIIGDPLYYAQSQADRGYLHAYALRFIYLEQRYEFISLPTEGELYLDSKVIEKLSELKKPWQLDWPRL